MNLSGPKQVLDMDCFLPLEGEERVDIIYSGGDLSVEVFYEREGCALEMKASIRFLRAKYFIKTPFPGISFFNCQRDREISLLNSVVEYEYSDMLEMERKRSGFTDYRHYRLFFHSVGEAIHVIAKSIEVSKE